MMKLFVYLFILFTLISCDNVNDEGKLKKKFNSTNNPNPNHLSIAKELLAPALGEWTENISLVDSVIEWTLYISGNNHTLVCFVKDDDQNYSGWAIKRDELLQTTKITCYCGNLGGNSTGKCKARSDMECIKDVLNPCSSSCNKKIENMLGWDELYSDIGWSLINYLYLPNLSVIIN